MKTQMAAVDFWLGAKRGSFGGWCCFKLGSEKPSNPSEVGSTEDVEELQFWHGMGLESQRQGFLSGNSQCLRTEVKFRFFSRGILICLQE